MGEANFYYFACLNRSFFTMHLTLHLLKHPKIRNVQLGHLRKHLGGAVDRGKHKVFSPICPWDKHAAMDRLVQDQKNLEVLSRPFVTTEQAGPKGVAKAEFLGMSTRELIDEMEWKANLEHINRNAKRFHMKSRLHPAPWIVRKEYLDRIGIQTMKENRLLKDHFKTLKDSDY